MKKRSILGTRFLKTVTVLNHSQLEISFLWIIVNLALCVFVVVHSVVWFFGTPWTAALQASLSFTISQSLLKLIFIELMMPSNHFIICFPVIHHKYSPSKIIKNNFIFQLWSFVKEMFSFDLYWIFFLWRSDFWPLSAGYFFIGI